MAVIKEFNCIDHGNFESSHPICPNYGCDSAHVERVFLTPPGIGSNFRKRFDAGIRKSADMMNIRNFRSAREGEASYGGDKARELGQEILWGNDVQKKMGHSFAALTGAAQKPLVVQKRDGSGELRLDRNNGMREAATEAGITGRRLPKAGEITVGAKEHKANANPVAAIAS